MAAQGPRTDSHPVLPHRTGPPVTPSCVLQVSRESMFNKMTSSNLACVFGLNLIWPSQGMSSLSALVPLNLFTELLIEYHGTVFSTQDARGGRGAGSAGAGEQGGPFPRGLAAPAAPRTPASRRETPLVLDTSR